MRLRIADLPTKNPACPGADTEAWFDWFEGGAVAVWRVLQDNQRRLWFHQQIRVAGQQTSFLQLCLGTCSPFSHACHTCTAKEASIGMPPGSTGKRLEASMKESAKQQMQKIKVFFAELVTSNAAQRDFAKNKKNPQA